MRRDLQNLADRRFDILVIGGGIHGLFAAYDAASRGLSVALVEAGDFGGGLTFNHQRTLHGGLRSLQSGNLLKARRQILERRTWAVIAPHLVRPLPFLIGTYRGTKRSRMALRLGLAVYDVLGRSRNAGVTPELHLPHARLETPTAARALFRGIDEHGLTGGAVWYDYQTRHSERLTWCVALAAEKAGATLLNYTEAVAPLRSGERVRGAVVRDRVGGHEHAVEAECTVIAAGSGLGRIHAGWGLGEAPPLLRAVNALVDRPARDIALAAQSASGRMLTAVPWVGHVLVGTHQSTRPVEALETEPPAEFVHDLLTQANAAFPALDLTPGDVRLVHHGLTPAILQRSGEADLMPDHQVLRHSRRGAPGVVSLVGVKYTTARLAAADAIDAALADGGRSAAPGQTATAVLPHAGITDAEGLVTEETRRLGVTLEPAVLAHLTSWYGDEAPDVLRHAAGSNGLDPVVPGSPVLAGEISYAAERGAVVHLADAALRRTALAVTGHPGTTALRRAALRLAPLLGWDEARIDEETAAVDRLFPAAGSRPAQPTGA